MNFNFIPHASQPLHQFFTFSPQLISRMNFGDSCQIFNGNMGGQHKNAYQHNLYNLYTFSSYFLHN